MCTVTPLLIPHLSSHPSLFACIWMCVCSLEMAKLSIQAASSYSSSTPIDFSLGFSQSTPSVSTGNSMSVLAAPPSAINVHSPPSVSSIPSAHYALPVSSLFGMKTLPWLAVHSATSAGLPAGFTPYTAKIPTSSSFKKSERQKFAPYWAAMVFKHQ